MPLIEILHQEVWQGFSMFTKEDGLKKLQATMSISSTINIKLRRSSKMIQAGENYDEL
jgi:hypothetical protein